MAGNVKIQNANGKTVTLQNPDTNLADATVDMDKVVVKDANGNVGIGVVASAWGSVVKALDINGGAVVATSNNTEIHSNSYYNGTSTLYKSNGYATKYAVSDGAGVHRWYTAPLGTSGNTITWTNAMTLDAGGDLSVRSGCNLGFDGGSYVSQGNLQCFYGSTANYSALYSRNTSNTDTTYLAVVGSVIKSAILANGNFQSATNSYGSTSDAKLKENVQNASPKLDKLMQVQVRTFNYIGQEEKQIGVVAQEIEQIFPSIVYETKDTKQVEVEKEDGTKAFETVETGEVTKNVKYSVIYMMMLKAMQEQQEIINDLKTRLEILEGGK